MGAALAPRGEGAMGEETRSIELSVDLPATIEDVFRLWTTADGVRLFLGHDPVIDAKVRGRYEIGFDKHGDAEGNAFRTSGAKVRAWEPPTHVAFDWSGPPWAMKLMNNDPPATWIDVRLIALDGAPARTRVQLTHQGFGTGGEWDRAYAFFESAWKRILARLESYCVECAKPVSQRRVRHEVVVNAPVSTVWHAWTTVEGLKTFIAEDAKVDLKPGGAYEWYFSMRAPEGQRGAEGCTVLSLVPEESLRFTWNAPPSLPALRKAGARSEVLVELKSLSEAQTRVTLTQSGFGDGEDWKVYFDYFYSAWRRVLDLLEQRMAAKPRSRG
ncbi:MAG: SRPBCC domain-containing protein [Planctomycetota bacterium]